MLKRAEPQQSSRVRVQARLQLGDLEAASAALDQGLSVRLCPLNPASLVSADARCARNSWTRGTCTGEMCPGTQFSRACMQGSGNGFLSAVLCVDCRQHGIPCWLVV